MDPLSSYGASPTHAQDLTRTTPAITGPQPRLSGDASTWSTHQLDLFVLQMQQSTLDAIASLQAEDEELGGDGSDGGGEGDSDLFGGLEQAGLGALGGMGLTEAGAGDEAALAQQLLGSLPPMPAALAPPPSASAKANAAVVAEVARGTGVDPTVAVAMMLVESGGNSSAIGDGGTSFGLFQLHDGGMLTASGLTPDQAFDPRTNATVALRSLAHEWAKGPNRSPGAIAAASQRPADPVGYAAKVDAAMARARALLG